MYLRDLDEPSIKELAQSISTMEEYTLYDSIQNTEKLYIKLMIEQHNELQRAQRLGLFNRGKKVLASAKKEEERKRSVMEEEDKDISDN